MKNANKSKPSVNAEYLGSWLSQMPSWCIGSKSKVDSTEYGSNITGTGVRGRYTASYKMPFNGFLNAFFRWDCYYADQAALQILQPNGSLLMEQVVCPPGETNGSYWLHKSIGLPLEKGMIVRFRATENDFLPNYGHLIYMAISFV